MPLTMPIYCDKLHRSQTLKAHLCWLLIQRMMKKRRAPTISAITHQTKRKRRANSALKLHAYLKELINPIINHTCRVPKWLNLVWRNAKNTKKRRKKETGERLCLFRLFFSMFLAWRQSLEVTCLPKLSTNSPRDKLF